MTPAHNLLCNVVTDDYGMRFQVLPPRYCDASDQSNRFWLDGFTDPDFFDKHVRETQQ